MKIVAIIVFGGLVVFAVLLGLLWWYLGRIDG